ncbi:MAG TPA: hypothetical protein VHG28_05215 [Longimicrobiaceae bacterium]|nr:hypothetical protein [Longimicrobiaceae bacterium]
MKLPEVSTRALRLLVLAWGAGLLLHGCGDGPLGFAMRRGSMELDLRPLFGRPSSGLTVVPGTVIDSIGLEATPQGAASPLVFGRRLARGDSMVSFGVRVPGGRTRFSARVLSTNGTVLFAGDSTARIRRDGFLVVLDLLPRAPVMVVAPDSLRLVPGGPVRTVTVSNRGIGELTWRIDSIRPSPSGITFEGMAGRPLAARDSVRLVFRAEPAAVPGTYTAFFSSPQGSVGLRLDVSR